MTKSKKINELDALTSLTRSTNYAIPILDLNDRDEDGDPKLKQVPINLLQALFKNETALAKVATSGKYSDLKNLPQLFSGNYADLSGKPTIPSRTSEINNDSKFCRLEDMTTYPHGSTPLFFGTFSSPITVDSNGTWYEEYRREFPRDDCVFKLLYDVLTCRPMTPVRQVFQNGIEIHPQYSHRTNKMIFVAVENQLHVLSGEDASWGQVMLRPNDTNSLWITARWQDYAQSDDSFGFFRIEGLTPNSRQNCSIAVIATNKPWGFVTQE